MLDALDGAQDHHSFIYVFYKVTHKPPIEIRYIARFRGTVKCLRNGLAVEDSGGMRFAEIIPKQFTEHSSSRWFVKAVGRTLAVCQIAWSF